jgi:chromosome segregation ATPase
VYPISIPLVDPNSVELDLNRQDDEDMVEQQEGSTTVQKKRMNVMPTERENRDKKQKTQRLEKLHMELMEVNKRVEDMNRELSRLKALQKELKEHIQECTKEEDMDVES